MLNTKILNIITFFYLGSTIFYLLYLVSRSEIIGRLASIVTKLAFGAQTIALIWRWVYSYKIGAGHAPMTNLYESMVFFAWCIVFIYLIFESQYKNKVIGVFIMPFAFFSMAYSLFLHSDIEPLMPALQSNWLLSHVTTCFFAYAAFAVSCGTSVMYLIILKKAGKKKKIEEGILSYFPDKKLLEEIIYKSILLGFPLLAMGIITGAIWANNAWGSYWSWDPKETWSLITWLIYAAFLHARITQGWRGKRTAILSIIGFSAVIFTYLGVNLILSGLHSYA